MGMFGMNLYSRGEGPYVIAGVLGIVSFVVINFIAMAIDPAWTFENNCLSDLSISSNTGTQVLFRMSCFITGILLIIMAVGKYLFESNLNVSASVFFVGASIGIFGVGVFSSANDTIVMHNIASGMFAACVATGVVLATVDDILHKDYLVLVTGIIIGIVALSTLLAAPQNTSEFITVICAACWFLVQLIKYYRNGLFSKAVSEETAAD